MRKLFLAGVVASAGALPWLGVLPEAHAIHGCVSGQGQNLTSGSGMAPGPSSCSFPMVDGDTYTGIGPFTITCGSFTRSYEAGVMSDPLTMIECAAGTTVTLDTTAGGYASAGSVLT